MLRRGYERYHLCAQRAQDSDSWWQWPDKGYPGPEITSSLLITISVSELNSGGFEDSSIDSISFERRAVRVLVGHHKMRTRLIRSDSPENSGMDREFNNCYSCRQAREGSCRRSGRDNPGVCSSLWQSEDMRVRCDYLKSSYQCLLKTTIVEPGEYVTSSRP